MADDDEIMIRVRTPVALAREAQRVAALHDESVSQVVRRALPAYVAAAPRPTDREDAMATNRNLPPGPDIKEITSVLAALIHKHSRDSQRGIVQRIDITEKAGVTA